MVVSVFQTKNYKRAGCFLVKLPAAVLYTQIATDQVMMTMVAAMMMAMAMAMTSKLHDLLL
jgi:hypothetical protein